MIMYQWNIEKNKILKKKRKISFEQIVMHIDNEERDLIDSIERGEWKSVDSLKQEMKKHQQYARNTLRKDKRVNIRISSKDLEALQCKAVEDGIPYQTLMGSILHRFVAGRFKEA